MTLSVGAIYQMTVIRKTDIGYMLHLGQDEVFLHFNESLHQELNAGDLVEAFLYFDNKGRIAATLRKPLITLGEKAWLEVTDVVPSLGVFLDMGIQKGVLLSIDDLPSNPLAWPRPGDQLFISLKLKGKLVAKLVHRSSQDQKEGLELKQSIDAYVQTLGTEGVNLLTEEGHWIFVHKSMIKHELRLGEKVNVKVTYLSEKGYTGSLMEQKETARFSDAEIIMDYIDHQGDLPLTADSTPEEIQNYFEMSRKAFKRALGLLYRERKIIFEDGTTKKVKP
jgi:predicted RNA-binding protein (virulence factor B family)